MEEYLSDAYIVLSLDFQAMGTKDFSDEATFSHSFMKDISRALKNMEGVTIPLQNPASGDSVYGLKELFIDLSSMCENSLCPIVLMIDSESYRSAQSDMNQFIENGRLNMTLLLEKFVTHFHDVYGKNDAKFIEDYGRKFFLLYLKPIINGIGNYYVEAVV